jgi:hypothetical protein
MIAFGPDGMLFIATGDGGGSGDPDRAGQDLGSLLGKILRVDVDSDTIDAQPYAVPPDNPFGGRAGARPEIWDFGLRNPWRFSFDRATGALFIADVGQGRAEEVNAEPAGEGGRNYGWSVMEGLECYRPQSGCERIDADDAVRVDRHDVDRPAALREGPGRLTHGRVFDRTDDHAARAVGAAERPPQGEVVGLRPARREDDLPVLGPDEGCDLGARRLDGAPRLTALTVELGRVAVALAEERQHGLEHARVDGGRGGMVEVDRLHGPEHRA